MNLSKLSLALLGVALALCLPTAPANAQATRTWVSGVGDDANPCSRTAPCKTFAGAISKTAPGGEIDALDPGGFGALTITKSITLDGGGGQVASVLVAGTPGIVVAAGATDVVIIRNMRLDGLLGGGNANAGNNGIRFISGLFLAIDNCDIFGFSTFGIDLESSTAGAKVIVNNTRLLNNNAANTGGAILVKGAGTAMNVTLKNVVAADNFFGIKIDGNSQNINVSADGVVSTGNGANGLATVNSGAGGTISVDVVRSEFSNNAGFGVIATAGTVTLGDSHVFNNTSGSVSNNGNTGAIGTYKNNMIAGGTVNFNNSPGLQ